MLCWVCQHSPDLGVKGLGLGEKKVRFGLKLKLGLSGNPGLEVACIKHELWHGVFSLL